MLYPPAGRSHLSMLAAVSPLLWQLSYDNADRMRYVTRVRMKRGMISAAAFIIAARYTQMELAIDKIDKSVYYDATSYLPWKQYKISTVRYCESCHQPNFMIKQTSMFNSVVVKRNCCGSYDDGYTADYDDALHGWQYHSNTLYLYRLGELLRKFEFCLFITVDMLHPLLWQLTRQNADKIRYIIRIYIKCGMISNGSFIIASRYMQTDLLIDNVNRSVYYDARSCLPLKQHRLSTVRYCESCHQLCFKILQKSIFGSMVVNKGCCGNTYGDYAEYYCGQEHGWRYESNRLSLYRRGECLCKFEFCLFLIMDVLHHLAGRDRSELR